MISLSSGLPESKPIYSDDDRLYGVVILNEELAQVERKASVISLDFDLSLNEAGGEEGKGVCEETHVYSKLQVLIHPEVAIESLLCWVNFYDKNNESICMLKVVVSYQPIIHSQQSRSGFSSFFKTKKKNKHKASHDLMSSFKAQQVVC